jgi:UDP-galactopyranose mutase
MCTVLFAKLKQTLDIYIYTKRVYVEKNNLTYDLPTDLYQIPQMHFSKKSSNAHLPPSQKLH